MSSHDIVADTQQENGRNKLGSYVIGFILSIILSVGAFLIVQKHLLSTSYLYVAVTVLALIQTIVMLLCFLRWNTIPEKGRWNLIAFIFTIIVIMIVVGGSLWIMYNLNYNMAN